MALKAQAFLYSVIREAEFEKTSEVLSIIDNALFLDPKNSLALWLRAIASYARYLYDWSDDTKDDLQVAWNSASAILEIDQSDARGYAMRAIVRYFRHQYNEAISDARRAFQLNPSFSYNLAHLAHIESMAGHLSEAKDHAELSLRLSPGDADIWVAVSYLALMQVSFAKSEFEEAKHWGREAIRLHPNAPIRRALMIAACAYTNDIDSAREHIHALKRFSENFLERVVSGEIRVYKNSDQNELLRNGISLAQKSIH